MFGGPGTLKLVDGTVFSGIFEDEKCPKIGRTLVDKKDLYEGEFDDFKPDGIGRMEEESGSIYEGGW